VNRHGCAIYMKNYNAEIRNDYKSHRASPALLSTCRLFRSCCIACRPDCTVSAWNDVQHRTVSGDAPQIEAQRAQARWSAQPRYDRQMHGVSGGVGPTDAMLQY
jgi:hypothetical protein